MEDSLEKGIIFKEWNNMNNDRVNDDVGLKS